MPDKQFALVLRAEGHHAESHPMRRVNTDYIRNLVGETWYPNDWLRFTRMANGGPPALMRTPKTDAEPGKPDPEVTWFYALLDERVEPGMTFSRLEAAHGHLARVESVLESGRQ